MHKLSLANIFIVSLLMCQSAICHISPYSSTNTPARNSKALVLKLQNISRSELHNLSQIGQGNSHNRVATKHAPQSEISTLPIKNVNINISDKEIQSSLSKSLLDSANDRSKDLMQYKSELRNIRNVTDELNIKLNNLKLMIKKFPDKLSSTDNSQNKATICENSDVMSKLYTIVNKYIKVNEPSKALIAINIGLQLAPSNLRLLKIKSKLKNIHLNGADTIKISNPNFGYF